jgi:predicted O-methyltransferase YrrM
MRRGRWRASGSRSVGPGEVDKRGAIQRDEALLLKGLLSALRPQTVVEIGFLRGASATEILDTLDAGARLYSFDIDPASEVVARETFGGDQRLTFRLKSQAEIGAEDLDDRPADFVFLDASHVLTLNQETFRRLIPLLSPWGIVAVHDTGTWARRDVPDDHWWHTIEDGWIGDEREVVSAERAFVNWILDEHPEFSQLHIHTVQTPRYGITLLQRRAPLPRPPVGKRSHAPFEG